MDPFAYQGKPKKPSGRKMMLLALAAASLSVWYFDLFPEFAPVPTGDLEPVTSDALDEKDFLELLETAPDAALASTDGVEHGLPSLGDDPLIAALASQSDPAGDSDIENAFPEFGRLPDEPQMPAVSGVRQASFEVSEAARPPMVLSPEVAEQIRSADAWIEQGETLEAHAALSRLYWKQPQLRPEIRQRIERTAAQIYASPATHFAEPHMVEFGDTLESIAKGYKVPWQYLARLNRTTPETLQAGQNLKVLTGPFGAVVDLEEFELTVHAHGWFVRRYDIGIGADGRTPLGEFTVQDKLENPTWHNPAGGVVAGDDPSNPLGEYWLGLGNHIGIHGTIDPDSIGKAASRGCIHLADGDIAEIFQLLGVGSPVVIRN